MSGWPGIEGGSLGFSRKLDTRPDVVDVHHAELGRLQPGHGDAGDREIGLVLAVERDHLGIVHLVDMIAGEDQRVARGGLLDRVDVLIDRVGGALVPVLGDPLLGRDHLDVLVELAGEELPPLVDVPVQAHGLVLGEDEDLAEVGVDAVREREVDDPVDARRTGPPVSPDPSSRVRAAFPSPRRGRPP